MSMDSTTERLDTPAAIRARCHEIFADAMTYGPSERRIRELLEVVFPSALMLGYPVKFPEALRGLKLRWFDAGSDENERAARIGFMDAMTEINSKLPSDESELLLRESPAGESCSGMIKSELRSETDQSQLADGPQPGRAFAWRGKLYEGLTKQEALIIAKLWESRCKRFGDDGYEKRICEIGPFVDEVWGDKGATTGAIANALDRLEKRLLETGLTFTSDDSHAIIGIPLQ